MNNQPNPPQNNEQTALRLEVFRNRLKKREVWLNTPIDDTIVERLYASLVDLEQQDKTAQITVIINSNGGGFHESVVATDIMGTLACPVKTIALANALSGGFIIFMGGEVRIAHENSCLMMHTASFGGFSKIPDVQERLSYLNSMQERVANFFSKQTHGKTNPQYWLDLFRSGKDKWFSIEEALMLGIVDKVISREAFALEPSSHHMWNVVSSTQAQAL